MPRINPLPGSNLNAPVEKAFEQHVLKFDTRITNMKATLGHSLLAFEVYMHWYPLYKSVEKILGRRLAYLYQQIAVARTRMVGPIDNELMPVTG